MSAAAGFRIVPGHGIAEQVTTAGRFRVVKVAATSDQEVTEGVPDKLEGEQLGDLTLGPLDYVDGPIAVYKGTHSRNEVQTEATVRVFSLVGRHADENRRLSEQMEATPRIRHDNIELVLDSGRAGDNFYFAVERFDGESLEERVERDGALPPEVALSVLQQAAAGLSALHSRGRIHGNVCPAVISINAARQVKVGGVGQTRAGEDVLSIGGEVLGDADYIAPERIDGRAASPSSDIYSLGHSFYMLLAGRPPFAGNSAVATMLCHINQEPPELARIADGVTPDVVKVFHKMTGKTSDQRYQDTGQLLDDLRMVLAGRGSRVEPFKAKEEAGVTTMVVRTSLAGALVVLAVLSLVHLSAWAVALRATVTPPVVKGPLPLLPEQIGSTAPKSQGE